MAPGKLGVWGLIVLCTFRSYPIARCARLLQCSASRRHVSCTQAALLDKNPSQLGIQRLTK